MGKNREGFMTYAVSACCFIRNNSVGFCLYESMASLLPYVSQMLILDLGSDDGTLEILHSIHRSNPKVDIVTLSEFPYEDAGVFATLANQLVEWCHHDNVLY